MAKMKTYKANLPEGGYQVGHFAYLICLICLICLSISSIYLLIYLSIPIPLPTFLLTHVLTHLPHLPSARGRDCSQLYLRQAEEEEGKEIDWQEEEH